MSNHFVQKIASVVLILGIFVSFFMAVQTANAQVPSGIPFGGRIIEYVPPTLACIGHTFVFDLVTNAMIAVAVLPPPATTVYENYDLTTKGTYLLGTYLLPPLPCLLPYPVLPIVQVGTS